MSVPAFSDRLIPLSDGRPGLRGGIHVEVRDPVQSGKDAFHRVPNQDPQLGPGESSSTLSENSCNSCLDFISSDETLDRYDEIISAAGWKLSSYHRNPVFQNAHQYGDIIFTLGRALLTEVRDGKLLQRIQFAVGANPMAKIAHALYKGKFLNAVSVGFIPLRWQDGNDSELPSINSFNSINSVHSINSVNSDPLRSPHFRRKYLEQELLEVSAVAIPANPNALALGLKSGALEKSDLRDLAALLRHVLATHSSSTMRPIRPMPSDSLLALAHELHAILKHT